MSMSWSVKNGANALKFTFQIVNGLMCQLLHSPYTAWMPDLFVVLTCSMLLGLQLKEGGTIHNVFGVLSHEAIAVLELCQQMC